ncbi:MAG: DNA recombination protein RmuC [Verrucomicrobiales bacterium]|nr:DNA recombination protein RmuC [Verrucomicrobiales bacterium]
MQETLNVRGLLEEVIFTFGDYKVSTADALLGALLVIVLFLIFCLLVLWRSSRRKARIEAATLEQTREAEQRIGELVATQNELTGRLMAMNESLGSLQSEHTRSVRESLETMRGWIGKSISETGENTRSSLSHLQERLAVIDTAQNNITNLTGQVVELQNILSNKQSRGSFGEARLQAIVEDSMPAGSYQLQATLSNGTRPDCIIRMPNDMPSLVIDSKFPLEAWQSIEAADTPEQKKTAGRKFENDLTVHIKAISEKYRIPGETHDTAFMFVPSESIFAEIHENHPKVIERAHRAQVLIVSPSLLMLSIQVIRTLLKDTRMREEAHRIKSEVILLKDDVTRLFSRVEDLSKHFTSAVSDLDKIRTSAKKVSDHVDRIDSLEFPAEANEE